MPLLDDAPVLRGPRVAIHPSIAVELEWALASAQREDYRNDHAALAGMYQAAPELGERVRSFWADDHAVSCGGYMELLVLAHVGGLLFSTDAARLLERLDELCTTSPSDLALASETEDDRAAILARLEQLRSSAPRRRDYVQLLTDVWTALDGVWERDGRRSVQAAIAARRELLAKGAPWREVARAECDYESLLPGLVDRLGLSDQLVVVPAFFTHRGLVVDLPGVVVVGVRTDDFSAQSRARTELLARRLKTISDPTRLAILDSLTAAPRTVTEISVSFGLAQPTVSNHIKQLRDAGLIANGHTGSRRELVVQPDAVTDLLAHLQAVLRPPNEPN